MKRIVCLGDSNTYGYDPRSLFGGRYPEAVRWTGILKKHGFDVCNCGQNGASIPEGESIPRLLDWISREDPQIITVLLGSNDLLNGDPVAEITLHMKNLLEELHRRFSETAIVLIAPVEMKPGEWVGNDALIERSRTLIPAYEKLAAELGVHFADSRKWKVETGYDGVHFTPEGHAAFAKGLMKTLKEESL